ncbi:hypothetical protein [Paenibacillus dokdonensis]|uniref:hypothetical protein n=1 Tax=Paenibacillus dokdonensis TaxID=2567944 RepID=UPI0010A8589D|nr:hypothetical protein [Paenibacillus dokdonensis]
MSVMTQEELKHRTEQIMDCLKEKWEEARDAGEDQLLHFFTAVSYALGSFVPFSVDPESYGPLTMKLIDSLTDGIQTAMQVTGVEATMIKIVKESQ